MPLVCSGVRCDTTIYTADNASTELRADMTEICILVPDVVGVSRGGGSAYVDKLYFKRKKDQSAALLLLLS